MRSLASLIVGSLLLGGCSIPSDPKGTLDRARAGTLRVGFTYADPWVTRTGFEPAGVEVALVKGFAARLGSRIEWVEGSEEQLFEKLEFGELDLVIGGITSKSPWKRKGAYTRPYATVLSESGKLEKHVMAAHMGENAFLTELDVFLQGREREVGEMLTREGERLARTPDADR